MQNNPLFHVDYNIELFAGMYLHPKKVNIQQFGVFELDHIQ